MQPDQNDLLELFNERAAIREYDANKTRQEAERLARQDVETYRHQCEVRDVVAKYRKNGADAVRAYLLKVEAQRGSEAADRLRQDVWAEIKNLGTRR